MKTNRILPIRPINWQNCAIITQVRIGNTMSSLFIAPEKNIFVPLELSAIHR